MFELGFKLIICGFVVLFASLILETGAYGTRAYKMYRGGANAGALLAVVGAFIAIWSH